jgi:hypothetical protein
MGYARRLPGRLAQSYGYGQTYTPGQIRTAVGDSKLDPRFLALAMAAYLEEADYEGLRSELPRPLDYRWARETFRRYRPGRRPSASGTDDGGSWGDYSAGDSGFGHGGHGGGHH